MEKTRHWYAIYTRPRSEKKVHALLSERGYVSYCPLNKVRKEWSDRVKLTEEPLFKSYVFVQLSDSEKSEVRYISGIVNFVYWLGKPAVIKDREIQRIRKFMNEYDEVAVEEVDYQAGASVVVLSGIFMDREAKVIRDLKNKVEIVIESLGCRLVAYVDKRNMELVRGASIG